VKEDYFIMKQNRNVADSFLLYQVLISKSHVFFGVNLIHMHKMAAGYRAYCRLFRYHILPVICGCPDVARTNQQRGCDEWRHLRRKNGGKNGVSVARKYANAFL